jgi:hypothetical protein
METHGGLAPTSNSLQSCIYGRVMEHNISFLYINRKSLNKLVYQGRMSTGEFPGNKMLYGFNMRSLVCVAMHLNPSWNNRVGHSFQGELYPQLHRPNKTAGCNDLRGHSCRSAQVHMSRNIYTLFGVCNSDTLQGGPKKCPVPLKWNRF